MNTAATNPEGSGRYEFRLQGRLDPRWATRFPGMTLATPDDGCTVLAGQVIDQAALHGLLHQLRDIGLPLISVVKVEPDHESNPRPTTTGA